MGFSQSMFFCQHVGLQQASCADLPLSLPVITDGGPPIVNGPNHSVCFRWNCADTFGAVSKGATLTDQCLDGPRESFRRAGLAVHTITPAALSAETLRMRTIPSHGVCGHGDKRIFRLTSALRVLMHRRRVSGRVVQLIAGHLSFGAIALARNIVPFWTRCMNSLRSTGCYVRNPWDSLKLVYFLF